MIDVFPVHDGDKRIGEVTSACHSPRLDKNIGLAMVPTEYTEIGTEVIVETPAGKTSGVVVEKPFIDPKKEIPKA
jgi:glycine cleavage system aminomethyltransferase T